MGRPDETSHLADLGVDGRIILFFFILRNEMARHGLNYSVSG
jgi:hypothetical protein